MTVIAATWLISRPRPITTTAVPTAKVPQHGAAAPQDRAVRQAEAPGQPQQQTDERQSLADRHNILLSRLGQSDRKTLQALNAIDIARSTGRPRNSISRAVTELLQKHLMTVETDPTDRRRTRLVPSPAGSDPYCRIEGMFAGRHQAMLAVLEPAKRDQLGRLLQRFAFRNDGWAHADRERDPT